MENKSFIPRCLLEKWEEEALSQRIPYTEFPEFIRMKEKKYWESLQAEKSEERIFANKDRTKLTEHGCKVVLEKVSRMNPIERVCKFARFDLEDMRKQISRGFPNDWEKETFKSFREGWYARLRENMKDFRISKQTLESFGLSWKEVRSFYFQTIV